MLSLAGFDVVGPVATLEEALQKTLAGQYDVALLDANLRKDRQRLSDLQACSRSVHLCPAEPLQRPSMHAGPTTHVKVQPDGTEDGLRLSVLDFGEGFDMDGNASRRLGLVSMEERARLVGGTVLVQSDLGNGTSITVTAPLAAGPVA